MEPEVGHGATKIYPRVQAWGCAADQGTRRLTQPLRIFGHSRTLLLSAAWQRARRAKSRGSSWSISARGGDRHFRPSHQRDGPTRSTRWTAAFGKFSVNMLYGKSAPTRVDPLYRLACSAIGAQAGPWPGRLGLQAPQVKTSPV